MNTQRAIAQFLQDWNSAGLDRLRLDPDVIEALKSQPNVQRQRAAKPAETSKPTVSTQAKNARPGAPVKQAPAAPPRAPTQSPASAPAGPSVPVQPQLPVVDRVPIEIAPDASHDERAAALAVLAEQVAGCTRCAELAGSRTQTVFGVGNPSAEIMFIGEAPGADEDRIGEPFVGKAGQLLDKIITASKLKREDIYICNVLRCRPPGNRNPAPVEAANCREYLDGQIRIVDPDYIICWGTIAAQNLLNVKTTIGRLRGKFSQYGRAKVLCTYHPSYLLRNDSAKKQVWADMKFFMADRGVQL